ncbi:MAG: YbfB/YjiJ family MFS transporter [Trueperaceae bacterium]|nr:YbfB/YjiJ family MFS transporter [Trueperaceae bacterium]MCO5173018.1 YbfB/YjiJ family MFS transporter [Trueperaceae bacterium]
MSTLVAAALLGLGPAAAVGVGRFAYALVLPDMLTGLGLSLTQAGLLGSANTGGYLLGALGSHRILRAAGHGKGFYLAAALQCLTLLALASAPPFWAMAALRLAQGVLGAVVFVGGAALVMAAGGRASSLGLYFGSIGVGMAVSTAVLPLAADWRTGWLWLGLLASALVAVSLCAWSRLREPAPPVAAGEGSLRPVVAALVSYGLYGAGYIAYMTFVTTDLRVATGPFWFVLGLGAVLNGPVWGPLSGRLGGPVAQAVVLLTLLVSSLPPLVAAAPHVSALLFGVSFLGVVTAITVLIRARLPAGAWPRAMGLSTAAFAAGQALGPALTGALGEAFGGATGALWTGSALLALALVVALLGAGRPATGP